MAIVSHHFGHRARDVRSSGPAVRPLIEALVCVGQGFAKGGLAPRAVKPGCARKVDGFTHTPQVLFVSDHMPFRQERPLVGRVHPLNAAERHRLSSQDSLGHRRSEERTSQALALKEISGRSHRT